MERFRILKDLSNYFSDMVDGPQLEIDFGQDHIIAHRYPEYPIVRRKNEGQVIMQEME